MGLYTLGAGLVSVVGGNLMTVDIHLPFIISAASSLLALLLIFALWRSDDVRTLDRR